MVIVCLREKKGMVIIMAKVLIVDDAAFMRISIKNMLAKNGYDVVGEAENGAVGVEMYKELQPDIVTMDITMPEMSGLDALKEITKFDSQAKVVMVSAMGQEAMVRDAIVSGAKGFIVKPFKEDGIIAAIKKLA
jgi:two-component system chemotaxis response regulator CheY